MARREYNRFAASLRRDLKRRSHRSERHLARALIRAGYYGSFLKTEPAPYIAETVNQALTARKLAPAGYTHHVVIK
jgi:hypothetical protein